MAVPCGWLARISCLAVDTEARGKASKDCAARNLERSPPGGHDGWRRPNYTPRQVRPLTSRLV
ncbi:MAG: hypothetical protein OXG81_03410 [Acidobacteria bacterium]|nr:hypothetical protein [Acidobacteriota bacterium]